MESKNNKKNNRKGSEVTLSRNLEKPFKKASRSQRLNKKIKIKGKIIKRGKKLHKVSAVLDKILWLPRKSIYWNKKILKLHSLDCTLKSWYFY